MGGRKPVGLGVLDPVRMAKIPPRLRAHHEFCFHIHDSMLSMFLEVASHRYPTIKVNFDSPEELERFQAASDPISYFLETDRRVAKDLSVGQAMMAVLSDFFNFIYEGLIALEKRKFVVAYALLRKPLKDNLLFLTMMLVDDDEFFERLEEAPAKGFGHPGLQDTHRRRYFAHAKEKIPFATFVDADLLHNLIFDVSLPTGLAPLFDKAVHLVTARSAIETEPLNLNFIFKSPLDDDVYETIYHALGYILLYAMLLEIELFRKAGFNSEKLSKWFAFTGMGAYHALFSKGRSPLQSAVNRTFKDFLICPHCEAPVKIAKTAAARFFVVHKLLCRRCGHEHDFPLFWLMSQAKWQLIDEEKNRRPAPSA
jgi:hypothetical protein